MSACASAHNRFQKGLKPGERITSGDWEHEDRGACDDF
jgi:hypothetical protein